MSLENFKMDRTQLSIGSQIDLDKQDREYWANTTIRERLETITYLRECFYGEEATTGRLQRIHQVLKQK